MCALCDIVIIHGTWMGNKQPQRDYIKIVDATLKLTNVQHLSYFSVKF